VDGDQLRICFDLDGVLCSQVEEDYSEATPNLEAIAALNALYDQGHTILIHTARFMGRCKSNPIEVYKMGYEFTVNQLESWGVKFHELHMGKPRYDLVIDDRSLFFDPVWHESFQASVPL
jgi:CMP-N,N'-diacetyllegionaminic acid synthase